ncbi:MAG TPA: hypothetical protein ENI52_05740 [Thermoplasmata archaeon]|nr:hypothetical protein [Thermoplasmata archaeon]
MLVRCPNCKKEFIVGEKIFGECPNCKIKLFFKEGNEVVELVDIKEIEKKVDEISENKKIMSTDKIIIDILEIEDFSEIEKKVDEL